MLTDGSGPSGEAQWIMETRWGGGQLGCVVLFTTLKLLVLADKRLSFIYIKIATMQTVVKLCNVFLTHWLELRYSILLTYRLNVFLTHWL